MKHIVSNIRSNIKLEENLKLYGQNYIRVARNIAYAELSIQYFDLCSKYKDMKNNPYYNEYFEDFSFISECISNLVNNDKIEIEKVFHSRKENAKKVYKLTALLDKISVYERVLNGVETKFVEDENIYENGYTDEKFTKEIMRFIVDDEKSDLINLKISQVISELPLKLTKNKFFEYLTDGIGVYKNQPKSSVNSLIYMLKTSSMLESVDIDNEDIKYKVDYLSDIDISEIDNEEYKKMSKYIDELSEYIDDNISIKNTIQLILNYLIILSNNIYDEKLNNTDKVSVEILRTINQLLKNNESLDSVEEMFEGIEGYREDYLETMNYYDITEEIHSKYKEKIEQLEIKNVYDYIYQISYLISDNLFIDFDEEIDDSEADDKYIKEVTDNLIEEYSKLFKIVDRNVRRRIMAIALSNLPVFFNNISQLQDFIYLALSSCSNKYEKMGCVKVLKETMDLYK